MKTPKSLPPQVLEKIDKATALRKVAFNEDREYPASERIEAIKTLNKMFRWNIPKKAILVFPDGEEITVNIPEL